MGPHVLSSGNLRGPEYHIFGRGYADWDGTAVGALCDIRKAAANSRVCGSKYPNTSKRMEREDKLKELYITPITH